jgi:transposase
MVAANAECALIFSLSPGNSGDAPEGRKLLALLGPRPDPCNLLMDGAYEGNETQRVSRELGFIPVVPPNPNRLEPWEYDKELYTKRNEIERLFRRLKGFRRVFTRFDKLDVMYLAFVVFALIFEALK